MMQTRASQNRLLTIWDTIRGDSVLLLCLFLSVSQISDYAKFFILPAAIIVLSKSKMTRRCKKHFTWLMVFSFFYLLPYLTHLEIDSRMNYLVYLFPPLFFMLGSYIGNKYKYHESSLVVIVFILTLVYASYYFVLLSISTILNKGSVLENRMLLDSNGDITLSATLYGLYSSVLIANLAFVFMPKQEKKLWFIRLLGILLAIMATWNMVTTLTRTSVYEAIIMLWLSLYMMLKNRNNKISGLLVGFLFLMIVGFVILDSSQYALYLDAFQTRDNIYGHDAHTFGGRLLLWQSGFNNIFSFPFGTPKARIVSKLVNDSYAHNMWIDVGLVGGIIPFIILVIFSFLSAKNCLRLMNDKSYDYFTRLYFTALFITFIVSCFLEPVLEAIYAHFLVYLVICGVLNELEPKY